MKMMKSPCLTMVRHQMTTGQELSVTCETIHFNFNVLRMDTKIEKLLMNYESVDTKIENLLMKAFLSLYGDRYLDKRSPK